MIKKKIVLGTANFGNYYGLISKTRVVESKAKKIISYCEKENVGMIETSSDYKNTEKILGRVGCKNFKIITKLPMIKEDFIEKKIKASLINLNKKNIYALMLRNPAYYIDKSKKELWEKAKDLKTRGIISKLGITIYDPNELDISFKILQPDLVQFPYNLLDRRIESSGWLEYLHQNNVETHCRSIFLQGLLLRKKNELPKHFLRYKKIWYDYHAWLKSNNITAIEACINLALEKKEISKIIFGVESLDQLKTIINIKHKKVNFNSLKIRIVEDLIDPRKW